MTTSVIAALLALAVLFAWFGAAGFARLRSPLDRLHVVPFVAVGSFGPLAIAALVSEGLSTRFIKIVLLLLITLLSGAVSSHAIARALALRGSAPEMDGC